MTSKCETNSNDKIYSGWKVWNPRLYNLSTRKRIMRPWNGSTLLRIRRLFQCPDIVSTLRRSFESILRSDAPNLSLSCGALLKPIIFNSQFFSGGPWGGPQVAHGLAHGLAHGPRPRFCLHPDLFRVIKCKEIIIECAVHSFPPGSGIPTIRACSVHVSVRIIKSMQFSKLRNTRPC